MCAWTERTENSECGEKVEAELVGSRSNRMLAWWWSAENTTENERETACTHQQPLTVTRIALIDLIFIQTEFQRQKSTCTRSEQYDVIGYER